MSEVFTYIFAIFAGVIILTFLVYFAMQHMGTQLTIEVRRLAFSFDDTLLALSSMGKTVMPYTFGTTARIMLTPGKITVFSGGKNYTHSTESVIYSPKYLIGKEIGIMSNRFNLPFPITNFYYLTNSKYGYYILYDDEMEDYVIGGRNPIKDELPKKDNNFKIYINELSEFNINIPSSFKKINFVIFTQNFESRKIPKSKIEEKFPKSNIILVKPSDKDPDFGEIEFNGEKSLYFGRAMLFGAIFASDFDQYSYSLKKSAEKAIKVIDIYLDKTNFLSCEPHGTTIYSSIKGGLNSLKDLLSDPENINIEELIENMKELTDANREVSALDCPEVF